MAKNNAYTLGDFQVSETQLADYFCSVIENNPIFDDLNTIFKIAISNMTLFPNIKINGNATYKNYIDKWVRGYEEAVSNPPSKRRATPKGSCSDPAIQTIVQIATNADDALAHKMSAYHNLFMSAENIQGNLLEEYISKSVRPYGWIWCQGNVLRAIDFCSSDGAVLLQIKNKSNTENSSSSAIRTGTEIKKWYRLGTQTKNGQKLPSYKWAGLNLIINQNVTTGVQADCSLNEQSYQDFLQKVTANNTNIISDL